MSIPTINDNFRHTNRKEWANLNQHICLLPYSSRQFFHSTLSASPCCNLITTPETNFLRPIIEIKNHIREQKIYSNCSTCYNCEKEGKISERTRYLIELSDDALDKFIENQEVGEFYIHCTLSNLCNMACRSCNIHTSSLFAKIETGKNLLTETISDTQEYWNFMLDTIKTATEEHPRVNVVVSGGEGFVQADFEKLYNWLIDTGLSQKINFTINTNGSISNKDQLNKLCKNFKQISLAVSVDSIYENYHYVRWPYIWEKIESNLEEFAATKKEYENFNFFLTPVWSINNIFYVADWVLYFESFKEKHNFPYFFAYDTPLFQPSWLDVNYLPEYIKESAAKSLEPILNNNWLRTNKTLHANINNLYNILKLPTGNNYNWNMYLRKTAEWDIKTKASAEIYNNRLFSIMNDSDRDLFTTLKINPNPKATVQVVR